MARIVISRPTAKILINCPTTEQPVFTGLWMARTDFEQATFDRSSTKCPHCGKFHKWGKAEAFQEKYAC